MTGSDAVHSRRRHQLARSSISRRRTALFDARDDRPYIDLQLSRLEQLAKPGVAFRLVRKLLGFNADGAKRVEVVILSRNDPVSGLRA